MLEQCNKPGARRVAVLCLRPVLAAVEEQNAFGCDPIPGQCMKALLDIGGQRRGAHIETELHGGRHFVDVLPAWAGRADEPLVELAVFDRDRIGDSNRQMGSCPSSHVSSERGTTPFQIAAMMKHAQPARKARPPSGVIAPITVTPVNASA